MKQPIINGVAMAILLGSAPAQAAPREASTAFLFTYDVRSPAAFVAGYKQHLKWHRDKHDKLAWYGWFVIAGEGTGRFVDGTFGNSLEAIDQRPDLPGDVRDFARTAAPHARPVVYDVWKLWPEVSTGRPLENRSPSAFVDVLRIEVRPGHVAEFERSMTNLARHRSSASIRWTWYRSMIGQSQATYLILLPRSSWQELEGREEPLAKLARQVYGTDESSQLANPDQFVESVTSAVWSYRPDLSYFPD